MGHGLEVWGSTSGGAREFSLLPRVQTGYGTYAPSYPVGTKGSFCGGKRAGRDADHSFPSNAKVKDAELLYFLYIFMV
jgi:hypothetical protein